MENVSVSANGIISRVPRLAVLEDPKALSWPPCLPPAPLLFFSFVNSITNFLLSKAKTFFSFHSSSMSRYCYLSSQNTSSSYPFLATFVPSILGSGTIISCLEYSHPFLTGLPASLLTPATVDSPHGVQNKLLKMLIVFFSSSCFQ